MTREEDDRQGTFGAGARPAGPVGESAPDDAVAPPDAVVPPDGRAPARRPPPPGLIGPFRAVHIAVVGGSLAVVSVILVALMSQFGTGSIDGPAAPAPGASFYAIGEPGTGLAVGDRPPPFAPAGEEPVRDLDGQVVELAALEGQPVWVIFWATWCPPCQQETPDVQRAWEANSPTGLQIVAIDVQEPPDVARGYAQKYGLTYGIATDPAGSAFRNWTVFGLPTHYFIDRDGVIRDRWFGPMTLDEMQSRIDVIAGS